MKFEVSKSITIDAPIGKVRGLIEDFKNWNSWSPWTVLEPECTVDVTGTANEPGHSMSWEGEVIGAGKNTLRSSSDTRLIYDLEFVKPWKSTAEVHFEFEEIGNQSSSKTNPQSLPQIKVTWSMNSSMPFFMFFMIKTMKNMIGMDYQRGLIMLKALTEKGHLNCKTNNKGVIEYKGFSYVGIERTLPFEQMPAKMDEDFRQIVKDIVEEKQKSAMHWVCLFPEFNMKTMSVTYIAAVSDENLADIDLGSQYVSGKISDSKALEIRHDGAYTFLGNAWSMGMMNIRARKIKQQHVPFEQYWNSPLEVAPEALKTSIYFPIKS